MCLQTALAVAGIGLKVVEGVQANKAGKREAVISEQQAALARQEMRRQVIVSRSEFMARGFHDGRLRTNRLS